SQSLGGIQRDMMGLSARPKGGLCPSQRSHCDSTDLAPTPLCKRAGAVGARPGIVRLWGGRMRRPRTQVTPAWPAHAHILLSNDNVHTLISPSKRRILLSANTSHVADGATKYHNSLICTNVPWRTPRSQRTPTKPSKIRQIYESFLNLRPLLRDLNPSPSRAETVGRARVRGEAELSAGVAEDKHREGATKSFDTLCNLGRAEELSELLDGAYYHLGLCLKYYPPDEELAAIGDRYAQLHQKVAQRLNAEQIVALDMKISAHELKVQDEPVSEISAEPAAFAPPVKPPVKNAQPSETKHNWVPAYVLGGVSVATLASSIVLRVVAGNKKDKLDEIRAEILPDDCSDSSNSDQCSDLETANKTQRNFSVASDVTLIVGGVVAATTLGYVIYELVHKKKSTGT